MSRNTYAFSPLLITIAGLVACSSQQSAKKSEPARPLDQIRGKAQILLNETTASDAAMNAGGPSVYLVDGLKRYRLFLNKPFQLEADKQYMAEGINAQKAIDEFGDPDQGKNGYPLDSSCDRIVRMAWPGLAFDVTDSNARALRGRVKRYPARPVFLVTRIEPVSSADSAKKDTAASEKEAPEVSVPAEKQSALLIEGPTTLPAPLWEPAGGTARCKVTIDEEGKIAELNTGAQLCETVPWAQFRYKPTLKSGRPAKVNTEVEIHFDARK